MKSIRAGITAVMVLAPLAIASAAHAQSLSISDDRGDRIARGLDLVSVRTHNRDRAIVAQVEVARAVAGRLIVSIDPRRAQGVRLVNSHRPHGTDRNFVAPGSFSDRRIGDVRPCRGFEAAWDATTVTLRMPSRCLNQGNYGAIRVSVLTEASDGDTDWTPDRSAGGIGVSAWVPRG